MARLGWSVKRTEIGIDVRDQFFDEYRFKMADIEVSDSARPHIVRHAISHHDDERLGLAFGNQVVHDQAGVTLDAPAVFVLAPPMLQIENWVACFLVAVVSRRSVNEGTAIRLGAFRVEKDFAKLSVRHILDSVKVLVLSRNFHAAAPTHGTKKVLAVGVGNFGSVNRDRVVVKAFV